MLAVLLATVVLAGSIGGVVYASSSTSGESDIQTQMEARWEKIATIYEQNTGTAIDADQLKTAFEQADKEMQDEALDNQLAKLVEDGKITQEEADQYKTWLESKPDVNIPFGPGGMGGHEGMRGLGMGMGRAPGADDTAK
jgi:hypothetical protein